MSKIVTIVAAYILVALLMSTVSYGGINGTPHDFSTVPSYGTNNEVCVICHVPHNADPAPTPLWSHETTSQTYTLYSSPSMQGIVLQPASTSKMCLSCHDGTIAIDSFNGQIGTDFMDGGLAVGGGGDLSDDHPVGFIYDTALSVADGELNDPTTSITSLGDTIENDLLSNGYVECSSCHDAHDNTWGRFLRMPNDSSTLCLTCHIK
jgi:predicted CXXCH cytochrome family protein